MSKSSLTPCLLLAAFAAMPEALSAAGKCDLQPYMIKSPCVRPYTHQSLKVTVFNAGDVPSGGYTVGVKLDGQLVAEQHIDEGLPLWGEVDVVLDGYVDLEYGKTYKAEAYVETDEPDANTTNNSMTSTFKMPEAPAPNYPYIWDDATCSDDFVYGGSDWWGLGWEYDAQMHAFYIAGRASNWMGTLVTKHPITFAQGEAVTCSFEYGSSGPDVHLVLADKGQFSSDPVAEAVLPQSPFEFSKGSISFIAPGPMTVDFIAELLGDFYSDGSLYLRNICFTPAVPDMATTAILSPQFPAIACSSEPIDVVVRYTNTSAFDITAPRFSYAYGEQLVTEAYDGILAAGTSIDYHFHTPILADAPAPSVEFTAWCEADDDADEGNDELTASFCIYEPLEFPYVTEFTDDPSLALWSTLDLDGNHNTWTFDQVDYYNGPVLICDYGKFDDCLIMPAIQMPVGTARLTFGYWNTYAASRLRVLMGRTPSIDAMTEVLCYDQVSSQAGYALLDIEEPGIYYFAFEGTGNTDQMLLTDVKVDCGDGIVVNSIAYDVISGYNLTTSPVTIQIANHGVSEQNDIKVYYVADNQARIIELIEQELLPGQTLDYTFQQLADVSAYGNHTLYGGVIPTVLGEDENIFSAAQGAAISNLQALQLPYSYGFDDEERNAGWTLQADDDWWGDGWRHEVNWYANSHHADISASYSGYDGRADFWAFSEGVYIPAGEYEVAFYYRGRSYFGGPDYVQDLDVALGQGNNAEAMTVPVVALRDIDSHGCYFDRYVGYVTIPEDGVWTLGFHDVSVGNYGQIRVDDVSIRAIEPGLALPYRSEFSAEAEAQWTFHGNDTYGATQWRYTADGSLTCRHDGNEGGYFENLTTSPKLHVEPGREVSVRIHYNVSPISGPCPDLQVYLGEFDSMKQMEVVSTLPADEHEAEFTFTVTDAEGLYLGLRSATDISEEDPSYDGPFYTITIQSVEASYTHSIAIEQLSADDAATDCYNLHGQRTAADATGLSILRRQGKPGVKVMRK